MLALLIANAEGLLSSRPIPETAIVLGRRPECEVVVADATVSGRHVRLQGFGDHAVVTDLDSTNGTWLNGSRIQQARVNPGDELRFGQVQAQLMRVKAAPKQATDANSKSALQTEARLVALQGMPTGTVFDLDRPIWTLGKEGAARLVFVMSVKGWSLTLLDGTMPLRINGLDVTEMPVRLNDKDHIVYQGLALQFERT